MSFANVFRDCNGDFISITLPSLRGRFLCQFKGRKEDVQENALYFLLATNKFTIRRRPQWPILLIRKYAYIIASLISFALFQTVHFNSAGGC